MLDSPQAAAKVVSAKIQVVVVICFVIQLPFEILPEAPSQLSYRRENALKPLLYQQSVNRWPRPARIGRSLSSVGSDVCHPPLSAALDSV